jgi:macrolide-specific efflux system membrane fusion protein
VAQARGVLVAPMAAVTMQRGAQPGQQGQQGLGQQQSQNTQRPSGAEQGSRPNWANLSEEEREKMRAERRAQREAMNGGAGAESRVEGGAATPAARRATVKVMADNGSVQEREVQVGVTSRVQAEILSGLNEGEKLVTGQRQAGAGNGGGQQQQRSGNAGGPPPGGMPGMR